MSKEKYIFDRIKMLIADKQNNKQDLCPHILGGLIDQWEFDYGMESNKSLYGIESTLDDVIPFGQNYLNERRTLLDGKTEKALDALNTYDSSSKSAQDAAYIINTMKSIFEAK